MSLELTKQLVALQRQVDNLIKPEVPLGMSLVSETVLSIAAASVTFTSIPQGFRHLMIMAQARTDTAGELDTVALRFNGDTGASYDYSAVQNGTFSATRAATRIVNGFCEGAGSRSNCFSFIQTYISAYSRSDMEKYMYARGGVFGDLSADADLFYISTYGHWNSFAPITSVTILNLAGPNFIALSRFQLYGVM